MKRTDIKWLDFLAGINTLMITSETEFNKFRDFLDDIGLGGLLKNDREFFNWQRLSKINGYDPNCIIFEFQPGKGMTFGYDKESSKEWYGEYPLTIDVIDSFYNNSKLVKKDKVMSEKNIEEDLEK